MNSEKPFLYSSYLGRKRVLTTCSILMMKGAPDILFPRCSSVLQQDGKETGFDQTWRDRLQQTQFAWALEGKRVLLLSMKRLPKSSLSGTGINTAAFGDDVLSAAQDLQLVGLVGIVDPPREEFRRS